MPSEKDIKSFRKLVSRDHVLADKIRKTNNFQELASLAQQFGHQITASEFQEHAETIVAKRTQELEETSRYNQTKLTSNGFFRLSYQNEEPQYSSGNMKCLDYVTTLQMQTTMHLGSFKRKGGDNSMRLHFTRIDR